MTHYLLAASIAYCRVTIESAYHVSMGRYYGEAWAVPRITKNFGPRGRPNLQGPLLHAAISGLGRLFGRFGDDYIVANAILSVTQWVAAMALRPFSHSGWAKKSRCFSRLRCLAVPRLPAPRFLGIRSGWLFIFRTGTHYPLAVLEQRTPNRWSRRC
jgi:hypothetical protein